MVDLASGGSRERIGSWAAFDVLVVSPTPTHPQDHGNRKRIFEVCSQLKSRGARVHFVHYASEHDWRGDRPAKSEADMTAAWSSYQLVAPSRDLHAAAKSEDHMIDEWADPALSSYIRWAFSVRNYDIVLVNYTWLSFCLQDVPPSVYKILDTHDQFSGRRGVLSSLGINPEFFHTSPEQEAIGLDRADMVWAIKKSEQHYFEQTLGITDCLTLPHAEPLSNLWRPNNSPETFLWAGIIGAKNNINKKNIESFLGECLPLIESYMAPCKIIIAGSCSDDFIDWKHPSLEVMGRVPDVLDFYSQLDVVVVPMQISTGLKIKVAEALGAGAPLISHKHAMDGYPAHHRLHTLSSFREIGMELVKLAFDRSELPSLASCSVSSLREVGRQVDETLEQTRRAVVASKRRICVVVDGKALSPDNVAYEHLAAVTDYLRLMADLTIFVTCMYEPNRVSLVEHGPQLRIVVDPAAANVSVSPFSHAPVMPLAEWLASSGTERVYFAADLPGQGIPVGMMRSYVRQDCVELSGGDPAALVRRLGATGKVAILVPSEQTPSAAASAYGVDAVRAIPATRGRLQTRPRSGSASKIELLVIGRAANPVAKALVMLAADAGATSKVFDPGLGAFATQQVDEASTKPESVMDILRGADLKAVIDLDGVSAWSGVMTEYAQVFDVPVLSLLRGAAAVGARLRPQESRPATLRALFISTWRILDDPPYRSSFVRSARRARESAARNDAGWCWLWADIMGEPASQERAAKILFT